MLNKLLKDLRKLKNPTKSKLLQRFFKTGPGEYGEGDVFWGIMVPEQRQVAKNYINLAFSDIQILLNSKIHEQRLTGLIILTYKYKHALNSEKTKIYNFYLKNSKKINNWDLVDVTAPRIVGDYLFTRKRDVLYKLVKSKNLWERRIAIISTLYFIKQNDFKDTLKLSKILLPDKHDLIHKAVGWMLREVGKQDIKILISFLDKYSRQMPRTMLRYAIEKLSDKKRQFYLKH